MVTQRVASRSGCPPKLPAAERNLLSGEVAAELESLFKLLSNVSRLRILHALIRSSELCVSEIAATVKMKPQAVSNQLQRLSDKGIVAPRRKGVQIYYRLEDPCIERLLDQALCLLEDSGGRRGI